MRKLLPTLLILAIAAGAQAGVMMNFTDTFTDNADQNTPGKIHGGIDGTAWNTINTDAEVGGLLDDQGEATSVSVDLGKETGEATTTIDWDASGFIPNDLGTAFSTDIYDTNARSAIFVDDGGESGVSIAARVSGLDAGTYDFYVVGRNTNNDGESNGYDAYDVFAGTVSAGSGETDYSEWSAANAMTNGPAYPDANTETWVDGENFAVVTLDVADGEDAVIVLEPTTDGEMRGFINTLQVVPEPTTMALLGLGGLSVLIRRRRK
ncbi:MAG: PEP-CTERM sorting domain-containing protein [Phycisphaerae bacterium]